MRLEHQTVSQRSTSLLAAIDQIVVQEIELS